MKIESPKNGKSGGPDNVPNETIIAGRCVTLYLTAFFNKALDFRQIPKELFKSDIILLYKKGDANIANYRLISLQPCLYKLVASCLERRMTEITEKFQPVEEVGIRIFPNNRPYSRSRENYRKIRRLTTTLILCVHWFFI